jgi:pyruvate kinase
MSVHIHGVEKQPMRRTKIVCTIGPASREPERLRELMLAGLDVARLNFSHGDYQEHKENVDRIRAVAQELDRPIAILADLQGPKLRVGVMAGDGVLLEVGQEATLTTEPLIGSGANALPVQYRGLPRAVRPGDRVLLDDGLLELCVLSTTRTTVRCRVRAGGVLKSNKGMNLPRAPQDIPSITAKDRADLAFALEHGVDWIALSFVRSAKEVIALKQLISEQCGDSRRVPVMAKIEKPEALENIDEIIENVDAIMVARGDLGIEIRPEEVPMAQKALIRACNQAGIPVVTATQMLDSMIRNPRPTRAEASDVANAILDGTDAIMLSGETSIGAYPLEAVRTMARIAQEVEAHCPCTGMPEAEGNELFTLADAVSHAGRDAAHNLRARAIITPTSSGYTARLMSRYRPLVPIIAVTPDPAVQRALALCWGVIPLSAPRTENTDEMLEQAVQAAKARGLVAEGDTLVLTGGAAGSAPGTTNLMRVLVVE